jgi:hypothetical protein
MVHLHQRWDEDRCGGRNDNMPFGRDAVLHPSLSLQSVKTVQLDLSTVDAVAAATVRFAPADASVGCCVNYGDAPRATVLSERLDREFGVRTVAPVGSLGYLTLQFDARLRLFMLDIFTNPDTWMMAPLADVA